jgi:glycosyltransferase involved in cell wall biosynthesis
MPADRIVVIPLGVNLKYFSPPTPAEKRRIREQLKIPLDKFVIGSFQKDGNGWGEGLEPKLIKGPDIFCDVVEKLARKYDIFVLLTGPARGYVKKRLEKANIPYLHHYLDDPNKVARYFKVVDLYMVTSREEGGPKAILESMASGVPLVSTKVGMAPDVIKDGENGYLVDVEDVEGLYARACEVIESKALQGMFMKNGQETAKEYSWDNIADLYYQRLYSEVINV